MRNEGSQELDARVDPDKGMMEPHAHMSRVRIGKPPTDRWRCTDCHFEGTWDETVAILCTADLPPCKHCGQTPECAIDCPGMMAALSGSNVHVVTDDPKLRETIRRAKAKR